MNKSFEDLTPTQKAEELDSIFEEADDARTFCYRRQFAQDQHAVDAYVEHVRRLEEEAQFAKIQEYYDDFRYVVYCCGRVAWYCAILRGLREKECASVAVASKYAHDETYYRSRQQYYVFEARRAMARLKNITLECTGKMFPVLDRDFLNTMTMDGDRRKSYYYTIASGRKRGEIFDLKEVEKRYHQRLVRREKRAAK